MSICTSRMMKMKAPIVWSVLATAAGSSYWGLEKKQLVTLTVAKATKRFFERWIDRLFLNWLLYIDANALLNDIVFLVALLLVKVHLVIWLTKEVEAPRMSIVEDSLPVLNSKVELIRLKTDCVVKLITPPT